jgi:integrase
MPRRKRRLPSFVQRLGEGRYRGWWMEDGRRRYSAVVGDPQVAHELAVRERARVDRPGAAFTLADAMELVRKDIELRGLSRGTLRWYEDKFATIFGCWLPATLLGAITVEEVEWFVRTKRGDGLSPNSILHHLRALNRLFVLAMRKGLVDANPVARVAKPKAVEPRFDVFGWGEAVALLERVAEQAQDDALVLRLFLYSGLRRAEAARLGRQHVGAAAMEVDGKTGRRTLPLPAELREVVEGLLELHGQWVVGGGSEDRRVEFIRRTFERWKGRLGEPRLHPHALRHTFASELAARGVGEHVIADLLGHKRKRSAITQRYITVFGEESVRAMQLLWHSPCSQDARRRLG